MLFLIDAIGGLATAVTTGIVLPKFLPDNGMPGEVMTAFAIIGLLCGVYSLRCRWLARGNDSCLLRVIILANSLYALLTLTAVIRFYERLHPLCLVYFVSEMAVLFLLICVEVAVSRKPEIDVDTD